MLAVKDQAKNALEQAENILVVPAHDFSGDALASSFALGQALEKRDKTVSVFLPADPQPRYAFLARPTRVIREFPREREFALAINTREVPVKDLRYEQEGEFLKIYLSTPAELSQEHLRLERGRHRHDLIVAVSAPDFDALGEAFTAHPSLFLDVPLLNIDHRPANERFGKINLVDFSASTTAEVVFDLLDYWVGALIDEAIATALLAGILDGTKSFQGAVVSPKTLTIAASLVAKGAKREEIVQHLYKTRGMGHLKLWGRIIARLEFAENAGIAYAGIPEEDFDAYAQDREALPVVLEDLLYHFWTFPTIALYWREKALGGFSCLVASRREEVLARLLAKSRVKRTGRAIALSLDAPDTARAEEMLLAMLA